MKERVELLAIPTRVAHAGHDEHRYCGALLFEDLAGHESYTGLLALAVTGRRVSPEVCAVLDDVSCVSTVADPRIWPFKLTRVVAEFGSTQSAIAAGNLCLEEALIGPSACRTVAELLSNLSRDVGERAGDRAAVEAALLARVGREGIPPGWGVPFRDHDERLEALGVCLRRRGRTGLRYWALMERAVEALRQSRRLKPNITLGVSAAYLDLGFAPHEVVPLITALVQTVFVANAVEAARQAPSVLRRLPDRAIDYVGKKPRASPRSG